MDYKKFNGNKIEDVATRREDLSSYNNNFYEDDEGNIIYVWSNDDNYSTYTRITFVGGLKRYNEIFAESFTSNDDVMEVFSEFLNDQQTSEDYDEEDMLYNRAAGADDAI